MDARGTAFASDYDGTLCESNWETGEERFDPADLAAIRSYQAAGGLFGICTGRPYASIKKALEGILELDFYIVTTGAQVLDKDGSPLFSCSIDRHVAQELYERYASDTMSFLAVTESSFLAVGREFAPGFPVVSSLDDVEGELLGVSLECHDNVDAAHAACADMNARFAGMVEGFQNLGSVDVVAAGCSKGSGVRVLRDALGVSRVAGIGDSYNDLPLLGAADVSYTFPKAPVEVQDAATRVVANIAEALADFVE